MSRSASETFVQHFLIELPPESPASFEGFQALVSPMFELIPVHGEQPFQARVTTLCLPDLYVSRSQASASRFERHARTMARSGTDAIVVLVYLSAGFTIEINGRVDTVNPNEIVFLDLGRPVNIQTDKVDNLSLVVTRSRLEELTTSVRDIHGFVLQAGATRDLLLAHMRACAELGPRVPVADAAAISDITFRMVAASLNSVARRTGTFSRRAGLASLADIKQFIDANLARADLEPALLMREFSLSRATLYRMFEPIGGVAAFILERRLHRAFQTITSADAGVPRIKQLALELGFRHPSAFSRAFKKQFGVTPQEVRLRQAYPDGAGGQPWRVPLVAEPLVAEALRQGRG